MAPDHGSGRQTLGPRRADEVRVQNFQHGRACDPGDRAHVRGRKRDHRHDQVLPLATIPATARQPAQPQGEGQDQDRAHDEVRQRLCGDAQTHSEIVDPAVVLDRRGDPQPDANHGVATRKDSEP